MAKTGIRKAAPTIRVAVLLGPTAVGKTALSIALARKLRCEILSCDSRQVYRFMEIGTAKPTRTQRQEIRHWMIDILDPDEWCSAWRYQNDATRILQQRTNQGKQILLVGGTGLYFKVLSEGMASGLPRSSAIRDQLKDEMKTRGPEELHARLIRLDAVSAERIHPRDSQRIIRALEVCLCTGRPYSVLRLSSHRNAGCAFDFSVCILMRERKELYARINRRVEHMVEDGLWEEFLALRKRGYNRNTPGMLTVGYRELFDVEEGRCSMETAIERIRQATRRYAKKQCTWFSTQCSGDVIDLATGSEAGLLDRFATFLNHS